MLNICKEMNGEAEILAYDLAGTRLGALGSHRQEDQHQQQVVCVLQRSRE